MIFEFSITKMNVDDDEAYRNDAEKLAWALLYLHGYECGEEQCSHELNSNDRFRSKKLAPRRTTQKPRPES